MPRAGGHPANAALEHESRRLCILDRPVKPGDDKMECHGRACPGHPRLKRKTPAKAGVFVCVMLGKSAKRVFAHKVAGHLGL
jgi:hypothetical protein